jgi:hypothetical protein
MDMFDYWRVTHVKEWFSRWYKPHNCKQEKIVTSHPKWDIHVWPWTLCHKNWMIPQYFSPIEWENMNRNNGSPVDFGGYGHIRSWKLVTNGNPGVKI